MSFELVKLIDPIRMTIAGTFTPRGAYNAGTDYAVGDQIDYSGSSYIMYSDGPAGTLPTNTSYWGTIASKGSTGSTGAPGPNTVTSSTTTSLTGVLKGDGSTVSTATAGTDYQAPLTLTTTGTSGAATLVSNTLNIPQYSGGGGGATTGFVIAMAVALG